MLVAGCGTRTAIEWARSLPGGQVYAIDLSPASVEVARHLQREFGQGNLTVERRDLLTLSEADGQFDVACATGVLHHLADPAAGLRAVIGRLAPAGVLRLLAYSARDRYWIGEVQDLIGLLAGAAGQPSGRRQAKPSPCRISAQTLEPVADSRTHCRPGPHWYEAEQSAPASL